MATREENLKKINIELEKLSDDELEQVVGGFMTAYIFLYANEGDHVTYFKNPIGIPIGLNPASWLIANYNFLKHHEKTTASYSDFRNMCQNFANDNASQWKNPATWGNLVISAGIKDISCATSIADELPHLEIFYPN